MCVWKFEMKSGTKIRKFGRGREMWQRGHYFTYASQGGEQTYWVRIRQKSFVGKIGGARNSF